jgi:hypothetical protein
MSVWQSMCRAARAGYDPGMSRAEDAAHRAELEASAIRAEAAQAQVLIDAFVAEAKAKGIAPVPLRATLYTGQSVKTDKRGWYLRKNESLAIGDDGAYYILTVPGGLKERLRGVQLKRSLPPMYVGKGGKDGDTGDLREYLDRILQR